MCTWFSTLQNLNPSRMETEEWQAGYKKAVAHVKFVFELYDMQVQGGRYFLHEHPASATSWKIPEVVAFCLRYPHLYAVVGAMCQWGMTSQDPQGEVNPVLKLTRWLTNSPCLAEALDKPCSRDHPHTQLLDGESSSCSGLPTGAV